MDHRTRIRAEIIIQNISEGLQRQKNDLHRIRFAHVYRVQTLKKMTTKKLLSFHEDPAIKEKYLNRLHSHYKADEIIKGKYWENGKGCAVGCTIHSSSHDAYETELGISWQLAIIEDNIFEKLENGDAKKFPIQFLESIPIGIDTELVFKKFIIWSDTWE